MATPTVEQASRPVEAVPRPSRSPKTRSSSLRHKPRSQIAVKESEQNLHKLMEDFEAGRLSAFGKKCVLSREPRSSFFQLAHSRAEKSVWLARDKMTLAPPPPLFRQF